jgi:mRNA-decapping enzyme 1B
MNRNSQENLEVGVNGTMEMQLREPYLIFRDNNNSSNNNNSTSDETIRGVWFHNDNERKSVHTYLENVVKSLSKIEEMERNAFVPPALAVTTGAAGNDANGGGTAAGNSGGAGEKGQKSNVVVPEVNTNAAGAALLSTLTLNSNSAQKKQPQSSSAAASATKSNNSHQQSNSNTANANSNTSNVNALDKKSLQLALLSLIQEDRFLDLLHAQYLKVVRAHHNQQQQQQQQQQKSRKTEE